MEELHIFFANILEIVKEHESSWPFHEPVDPDEVPDYYTVIKDPIGMDYICLKRERRRNRVSGKESSDEDVAKRLVRD